MVKFQRSLAAVGCLGGILTASQASAAITYVDVTAFNTTQADGSPFVPVPEATRANTDNAWSPRTDVAGRTVFESNGTGGTGVENSPALRTTITGLTPGDSYTLYTFFVDQNSAAVQWGIQTGLSVGSLGAYTSVVEALPQPTEAPTAAGVVAATAGGGVGQLPAGSPVLLTELWQVALGTAVADGLGTISVYFDDFANPPISANFRTRIDAVGFELVPEPASLALLGLGGLALIGRRRTAR